jgi:hypothetical protein
MFTIDQHVKAQNLKAHRVVKALRLADSVQVLQVWLSRDHCLDYELFDVVHEQLCVAAFFLQDF